MFSRGMLRTAVDSSRSSNAALALKAARAPSPLAPVAMSSCTSFSNSLGRRYISVYGYTQAKALVYSKYGEPKDVLRYVIRNFCAAKSKCALLFLTTIANSD